MENSLHAYTKSKGLKENLEISIIQTIKTSRKRLIYKPSFVIFLNDNFWGSMCIFYSTILMYSKF